MAQRTFRSDDTSKWLEKYGNGKFGDVAPSGTTTDDQGNAAVTANIGVDDDLLNYTNYSGDALQIGDILYIVQMTGSGALTNPNNEFNVVKAFDGSTITTKYPMTRNWNTGAQVYVLRRHKKWTLTGGALINIRPYDPVTGTGGMFVRLANKKILVDVGTIEGTGKGLMGGGNENSGSGAGAQAQAGASPETPTNPNQNTANNHGGGGAHDDGTGNGASGSGGGNFEASDGSGGASGGQPGTAITEKVGIGLRVITMGPAGGGGMGFGGSDAGGVGGWGGAPVVLIAPDIEITNNAVINIAGEAADTRGAPGGSTGCPGGSGAAADFLAKGERVKIGNGRINNSGGPNVQPSNPSQYQGGKGSIGYGHVDYSRSFEGTLLNNASLTSRQDKSLNRRPSPAGLFVFLQKFTSR